LVHGALRVIPFSTRELFLAGGNVGYVVVWRTDLIEQGNAWQNKVEHMT
jgi:hypothetical protein